MADEQTPLRVLFCLAVLPAFFEASDDLRADVVKQLEQQFAGLRGRFGIEVIGTLDDDRTLVGPVLTFPWTCYILADAPDFDAVVAVCNLVRNPSVERYRLFRYVKIEARVGRPLFFGAS